MADEITPAVSPTPAKAEASGKSGYRAAPTTSTVDSRLTGGAGVQRSHLRDRKAWLKRRTRAGQTWAQRKVASTTYCPAKVR
jgi:hypothetical protein